MAGNQPCRMTAKHFESGNDLRDLIFVCFVIVALLLVVPTAKGINDCD
jgi:hypothetical protein